MFVFFVYSLMSEKPEKISQKSSLKLLPHVNMSNLAIEFGLIIAIPLVIFLLLGIFIDRMNRTTPIFMLCGFLIALIISLIVLIVRIRQILKLTE